MIKWKKTNLNMPKNKQINKRGIDKNTIITDLCKDTIIYTYIKTILLNI